MMLAKKPANNEPVCAEKSIPAWRLVSPKFNRKPAVRALVSGEGVRVSAVSWLLLGLLVFFSVFLSALRG